MVTDVNIGYYAGYAERGFGGIIQEATAVLAEGRITPWYKHSFQKYDLVTLVSGVMIIFLD